MSLDDDQVPFHTCDLQLDKDDTGVITYNNENLTQPKRLVHIPTSGEILAYGGNGSNIRKIVVQKSISSSVSTSQESAAKDVSHSISSVIARQYNDDALILAVTISSDGTRVVVGNDVDEIQVYTYPVNAVSNDLNKSGESTKIHPFCCFKIDKNYKHADETCEQGPMFGNTIRDLQFYPNQSDWLGIASENGLSIVSIEDPSLKYLSSITDGDGVRSIAFHVKPIFDANNKLASEIVVMASLSLDGRLSLWDVSDVKKPDEWKLLMRETSKCIPKNDVGCVFGCDPWDRSCRPVFLTIPSCSTRNGDTNLSKDRITVIALPGMPYLQLRRVDYKNSTVLMTTFDQPNLDRTCAVRGHVEPIVTLATSTNSSYLISSGRDKRVVVWSIFERKNDHSIYSVCLRQLGVFESAPTSILWIKKSNSDEIESGEDVDRLYLACATDKLVIIQGRKNIIPEKSPKRVLNQDVMVKEVKVTDSNDEQIVKGQNYGVVDQKSTPKSSLSNDNSSRQKDDRDETDSDIEMPIYSKNKKRRIIDFEEDDRRVEVNDDHTNMDKDGVDDDYDENDDDDVVQYDDIQKPSTTTKITHDVYDDASLIGDNEEFTNNYDNMKWPVSINNLPEPQAPFAISSTPLDLPRRFLCWNHLGSIMWIQDMDFGNNDKTNNRHTVNIDFADALSRRPVSFTDNLGFIIGSLGEDGALFATDLIDDYDDDGDDDDEFNIHGLSKKTKEAAKRAKQKKLLSKATGSIIYFNRYETLGNVREKDWVYTLPSGERALGCACGEGWAAVMTSSRFLRFFSVGGNQEKIVWIPGEPVTMVGRGQLGCIFYHESDPLRDGTQKIGYMLFNGRNKTIITNGSVSCISSGSNLLWAGFSNDGSLVAMDASGFLSMLVHLSPPAFDSNLTNASAPWGWVPLLDTAGLKKSSDDTYWPIFVYDGKLICLPLKGGVVYPDAIRHPVPTTLVFRMPLASGDLWKGMALDEISVRAGIALSQKKVMNDLGFDESKISEREYITLSAQVDKVTLKMFATSIQAGKLDRALDLVDRLHLEKSFELAMTIAEKNRRLVDMIDSIKERKFTTTQSFE